MYSTSANPTGRYNIETPEEGERAYFDVENTPELLRSVAALADAWLSELARWDYVRPSSIVQRLRDGD